MQEIFIEPVGVTMSIDDFKELLATSASFCTILQFLTGVLICQKFVQKGSTGDLSSFPFAAGFLSCSVWLRYGFLIKDNTLILVNTAGATLHISYVVTFYLYCLKKSTVLQQLLGVCTIILCTLVYTSYEEDVERAKARVGMLCIVLTTTFFAAPLTMLAHVIRVKSAESLPFSLISASLVVSLQWFLYGVVLGDPFVQIPNALGCLLAGFQLSLFAFYPGKPTVSRAPLLR